MSRPRRGSDGRNTATAPLWASSGETGSVDVLDAHAHLARAGRDGDEVLVADLDLDQRRDWLDLFPFLATRRPDTYDMLTEAVVNPRTESGEGEDGGIAGVSY